MFSAGEHDVHAAGVGQEADAVAARQRHHHHVPLLSLEAVHRVHLHLLLVPATYVMFI